MAVELKKYLDTFEVESLPFQTLKEARGEVKDMKSKLSPDEKNRVKFRIVKLKK